MLDNPSLWIDFKNQIKNIGSEDKLIKYTIVYDGEVDKISAEVISWNYNKKECMVCDIKNYIPGRTENLYIVGGKACNKIRSITKEKYTEINGTNRFDTLHKALQFICE